MENKEGPCQPAGHNPVCYTSLLLHIIVTFTGLECESAKTLMEHTLFPNGVGRPRAATISPESLQHCSLRANIKPEVVSFLIMFYLNMDTVGFKRA